MDYSKIYKSFIESRKQMVIEDQYFEVHHILPRAMGGDDSKENLIKLTTEDHFFAHILLSKIDTRQKHPLVMMMRGARHLKGRVLRRHVGIARRVLSQPLTEETKAKMKATHGTPEARARVSARHKGQKLSDDHKQAIKDGHAKSSEEKKVARKELASKMFKGKQKSDDHKKKLSIANINRDEALEKARREKISKANLGKVRSEDAKNKISFSRKNKPNISELAKIARAGLSRDVLVAGGKAGGKKVGSLPWWTNGVINVKSLVKPNDSFRSGMTIKKSKESCNVS